MLLKLLLELAARAGTQESALALPLPLAPPLFIAFVTALLLLLLLPQNQGKGWFLPFSFFPGSSQWTPSTNTLKEAVLRVPSMPIVPWVPGLEGQGDLRSKERGLPLAPLTEQQF